MSGAALAPGSISLRMYPHPLPPAERVEELRAEAALAERAGFDGLMVSEHHGGFPGYVPNPLQFAGWLLEATQRAWGAPCPLLLPLRAWTQVAEDLAWLAARFPGRVGAGFGAGGLALDFELAGLDYEPRFRVFRGALPRLVDALRGRAPQPLACDAALAACGSGSIPLVAAVQGPLGVRLAAELGVGLIYDSLQGAAQLRQLSELFARAGGKAVRIGIRRVWLGRLPREAADAQMRFYRSYASARAQTRWGSDELICAPEGAELAERLAEFARAAGCDALNLRVHLQGLTPAQVREQIEQLGSEVLPKLRARLAGAA
jgi:alkanesulfonate monooxygenase SsuD/methylene tetrahydromethanopterin reductase-like flavin-dependent oxidoreductase (luciferase family)